MQPSTNDYFFLGMKFIKEKILIFVSVLAIFFFFGLQPVFSSDLIHLSPNDKSQVGVTTEVYLPPGEFIPSDKPNTVSIDANEIAIILGDGTKEIVSKFIGGGGHYLTIKYLFNTDRLYFYNHGQKIGTISLKGRDFNVKDMVEDLGSHVVKSHPTPLSDKRIRLSYERTYNNVKVSPSQDDVRAPLAGAPNGDIASHLMAYSVITSNLVLNLNASNLNNAGNSADANDTSTTWTDRSGNGNNGTLTNFTLPTGASASGWDGSNTSESPSVLKFDGVAGGNFVDLGTSALTPSGSSAFTVALWMKANSTPGADWPILFWGGGQYYLQIATPGYGGGSYWCVNTSAGNTCTWPPVGMSLYDNSWHYLVLTYDGSAVKTYRDSVLQQSWGKTGTLVAASQNLGIGNAASLNNTFKGSITNVQVYSSALTADQISQNYLADTNIGPTTPQVSSASLISSAGSRDIGTGASYEVNYGHSIVINFTASDSDTADTVTLSTPTAPSLGTFTAGSAANTATATYTFSPGPLQAGTSFNFTVRATDNNSNASRSDLTVMISVPITPESIALANTIATAQASAAPPPEPYRPSQVIVNGVDINAPISPPTPTIEPPKPTIETPLPPVIVVAPPPQEEPVTGRPPDTIMNKPTPLPINFEPIDISKYPPPKAGPPQVEKPEPPVMNEPVMNEPVQPSIPDISDVPEVKPEFPKAPVVMGTTEKIEKVNVIFPGSPATFSLPGDSEATKILKATPLEELDVLVTIIDSNEKEYTVDADVLISAVDNSVQVTTDLIPMEAIEGEGTLVLFINGDPKAKIPVVVAPTQKRKGTELESFRPSIKSINISRRLETLKLTIKGGNFFDTINSKTEVTLLPSGGLEKKSVQILKGQKVMIVTYKITDKNVKGKINLSIVNSFGQIINTIEIPEKDKQSTLIVDEKKLGRS